MSSLIHDLFNQIGAVLGIFGAETNLGDFHQIRSQFLCGIPLTQNIGHLVAIHPFDPLHQVVGLSQDLLNPVLNPVVNGLHQMTGTSRTDVGNARAIFHLSGHFGDKTFNGVVGRFGTARHHAWTFQSPFSATGNAHPDEAKALAFQLLYASLSVLIIGVSSIN